MIYSKFQNSHSGYTASHGFENESKVNAAGPVGAPGKHAPDKNDGIGDLDQGYANFFCKKCVWLLFSFTIVT